MSLPGAVMPLVQVDHLRKYFPVQHGLLETLLAGRQDHVHAVDDVSFDIQRGEVFGLAGESGSGKSTTGRAVLRLVEPTSGRVVFDGQDLGMLSGGAMRRMRRRMQVIFQDPMASLNPRMSVGAAITHPLQIHYPERSSEHRDLVLAMLDRVGLTPAPMYYDKYPHQISGGQRQCVVIARALITRPDLVLADEPIAMADVSVRALLLELMADSPTCSSPTTWPPASTSATASPSCTWARSLRSGRCARSSATRCTRTRGPSSMRCPCRTRNSAGPTPCRRERYRAPSTRLPDAVSTPVVPLPGRRAAITHRSSPTSGTSTGWPVRS